MFEIVQEAVPVASVGPVVQLCAPGPLPIVMVSILAGSTGEASSVSVPLRVTCVPSSTCVGGADAKVVVVSSFPIVNDVDESLTAWKKASPPKATFSVYAPAACVGLSV